MAHTLDAEDFGAASREWRPIGAPTNDELLPLMYSDTFRFEIYMESHLTSLHFSVVERNGGMLKDAAA